MGASASMVQARLESDYGDEVGTWSDEMRDATIASITKTYESTLAATASPEEAYEAIKSIYLAAKRQAGKEHLARHCLYICTYAINTAFHVCMYPNTRSCCIEQEGKEYDFHKAECARARATQANSGQNSSSP